MQDLTLSEIDEVVGGETAVQRRTIGTGILIGGLVAANPLIVALGVLYLATN